MLERPGMSGILEMAGRPGISKTLETSERLGRRGVWGISERLGISGRLGTAGVLVRPGMSGTSAALELSSPSSTWRGEGPRSSASSSPSSSSEESRLGRAGNVRFSLFSGVRASPRNVGMLCGDGCSGPWGRGQKRQGGLAPPGLPCPCLPKPRAPRTLMGHPAHCCIPEASLIQQFQDFFSDRGPRRVQCGGSSVF